MAGNSKHTPHDWFQRAQRCYLEDHQGCAHCGQAHCVIYARWGDRTEYYCSACDFSTCFDGQTGRYFADVGDGKQLAETLLRDIDASDDTAVGITWPYDQLAGGPCEGA
jgi:hypothetical protein